MKVWQCVNCGVTHPGPSIELADAVCRCGRGKGRWGVSHVKLNVDSDMRLTKNIITLSDER